MRCFPITLALALGLGLLLALPANAGNPYLGSDGSWVSIDGTVVSVSDDRFTLDYGAGTITVELDDFDAHPEARELRDGAAVTVHGRIDDDLYASRTIEAATVFVGGQDEPLRASALDEEELLFWRGDSPVVPGRTTLRGSVVRTSPRQLRFVVETDSRRVPVLIRQLDDNPLDELGMPGIETGDWVSVTGDLVQLPGGRTALQADQLNAVRRETAR